jgi:hypothetical protein
VRLIGEDTQDIFKIPTDICGKLPGIPTSGLNKHEYKKPTTTRPYDRRCIE